MEHWSIDDYKEFTNGSKKKSKYRSYKISIDGHRFDSQKEADYYCELKLKLKANEIKGFCLQPTNEIIDVKGFKTKEYIAKKKVFEDKFNLKITEI